MREPIIEYHAEFNMMDFVNKYAEHISRIIDEQTLERVEHQLEEFGYVKVVRCRDCKWLLEDERYSEATCRFFCRTLPKKGYQDGFCAWAE